MISAHALTRWSRIRRPISRRRFMPSTRSAIFCRPMSSKSCWMETIGLATSAGRLFPRHARHCYPVFRRYRMRAPGGISGCMRTDAPPLRNWLRCHRRRPSRTNHWSSCEPCGTACKSRPSSWRRRRPRVWIRPRTWLGFNC